MLSSYILDIGLESDGCDDSEAGLAHRFSRQRELCCVALGLFACLLACLFIRMYPTDCEAEKSERFSDICIFSAQRFTSSRTSAEGM